MKNKVKKCKFSFYSFCSRRNDISWNIFRFQVHCTISLKHRVHLKSLKWWFFHVLYLFDQSSHLFNKSFLLIFLSLVLTFAFNLFKDHIICRVKQNKRNSFFFKFETFQISGDQNSQPLNIFRSAPKLALNVETLGASWNWFFRWHSAA